MEEEQRKAPLMPYSKGEIADMYGISMKSLETWLAAIDQQLGPRIGRYYSLIQVEIIFGRYGRPSIPGSNRPK
jgi:hypothetical protein